MVAQLVIHPMQQGLRGSVPLPCDEGVALPRLALAALSRGKTTLELPHAQAGVTALLGGLVALGVGVKQEGSRVLVAGTGLSGLRAPEQVLDVRGEPAVAALLLALVVSRPWPAELLVDPIVAESLVPALAQVHSLQIVDASEQGARLVLEACPEGHRAEGLRLVSPGVFSWQKEAVLLAGLRARSPSVVEESIASADHLERALLRARMPLHEQGTVVTLHPPRDDDAVAPQQYEHVGAAELAAYLGAAAALVPDSIITAREVSTSPARADALRLFSTFGLQTGLAPRGEKQTEPLGDITFSSGSLHAALVSGEAALRSGESALALLLAAARARGASTFSELVTRGRSGDERFFGRVTGLLRSAGVEVNLGAEGVVVEGRPEGTLRALRVTTGGDGRLAIVASLLGLSADGPSVVDDVECLQLSFPRFVGILRALGANIEVRTS